MKGKLCCLVVFIVSAFSAQAQTLSIDKLMELKPLGIGTHRVNPIPGVLYLPMPFAEARFTDTAAAKYLKDASQIHSVHLIYTRFREVDSFNQPKLNKFRFQELKKLCPSVFEEKEIQWKVLEQREATTKENAAKCFHGFVVYMKNTPRKDVIEKELATVKKIIDSYKDSMTWIPEKIEWKVKKTKIETGYYLPRSYDKQRAGVRYNSSMLGFREKEYRIRRDSSIKKKTGGYFVRKGWFDTSVFKNIHEYTFLTARNWSKKMTVVTDVTGSMSPYTTQVMLWLKYRPEVLAGGRFVFFNDGDAIPDILKKIGSTGGIHFAVSSNYDSVYSVMEDAMRKGTGGDIPENNIEAILSALKQWPDTDTVLLVADNEAPVKDMTLLSKIKKPVSVMVCGAGEKVHRDYVDIAKITGGRLFVLNTELGNLQKLNSGSEVVIKGRKYEYKNGELLRKKQI
jgi:hypothetical protein